MENTNKENAANIKAAHAPTSSNNNGDPPPEPNSAGAGTCNPTQELLMTSESEATITMHVRNELDILLRRLQFLNSPPGKQILNVFEQHIRDWAIVLGDLTRVEGRFARDSENDLTPEGRQLTLHAVKAGRAAVINARKVFDRYRTLQEMSVTVEAIFVKAEAFNGLFSSDPEYQKCASVSSATLAVNSSADGSHPAPAQSSYPLQCKQLQILDGFMDRVMALSVQIGQKITQLEQGLN